MINPLRAVRLFLTASIMASSMASAAEPSSATEKDPLRATLLDSKEKNKGVSIYASGATIAMVVTLLDERYVIGRSQQASRIVVRIDRIDSVSAAF